MSVANHHSSNNAAVGNRRVHHRNVVGQMVLDRAKVLRLFQQAATNTDTEFFFVQIKTSDQTAHSITPAAQPTASETRKKAGT